MSRKPKAAGTGTGEKPVERAIVISAPNIQTANFLIVGTTPYVQHKFPTKVKNELLKKMSENQTTAKKKVRNARDYEQECRDAAYRPARGHWPNGAIPCTQIKAAMVAACRLTDVKMTESKQCLWVVAECFDEDGIVPLFRITKGKPFLSEQPVRNASGGADIRIRPMWAEGWEAIVQIRFDAGMLSLDDVSNLLMRAGLQVGIGEGRMASSKSCGCGWGSFEVAGKPTLAKGATSTNRRRSGKANAVAGH